MNLLKTISILLFVLLTCIGYTQENRFNLSLAAGLNFSELEGNSITDYFGLNAGIIGSARLRKRTQLSIELLYSQNGEYILPTFYPSIQYGTIRLNHIEVPIHVDWLITTEKTEGMISWGLAFSKILNYYLEDDQGLDVTNQIVYDKTIGIGIQGGATYFFNDTLGFNFRANFPLSADLDWTITSRLVYRI